jgi:hypothetical protein
MLRVTAEEVACRSLNFEIITAERLFSQHQQPHSLRMAV